MWTILSAFCGLFRLGLFCLRLLFVDYFVCSLWTILTETVLYALCGLFCLRLFCMLSVDYFVCNCFVCFMLIILSAFYGVFCLLSVDYFIWNRFVCFMWTILSAFCGLFRLGLFCLRLLFVDYFVCCLWTILTETVLYALYGLFCLRLFCMLYVDYFVCFLWSILSTLSVVYFVLKYFALRATVFSGRFLSVLPRLRSQTDSRYVQTVPDGKCLCPDRTRRKVPVSGLSCVLNFSCVHRAFKSPHVQTFVRSKKNSCAQKLIICAFMSRLSCVQKALCPGFRAFKNAYVQTFCGFQRKIRALQN